MNTETEMNQVYYNDIADLVKRFPVADARTKFDIMTQLQSLTESFLDYYDYVGNPEDTK